MTRALRPAMLGGQRRCLWSGVEMGPPDGILGLVEAFKVDTHPQKVNLSVGAYRADDGKPWVLPAIEKAEKKVVESKMNKEYLPIHGDAEFVDTARRFALGHDSPAIADGRIASVQTLSGTGACRIIGEFYSKFLGEGARLYLPTPSWGNHGNIFRDAGLDVRAYRYWDKDNLGLDLDGMLDDLRNAPDGSAVLLHACAHNPTGVDPTPDQWKTICAALKVSTTRPMAQPAARAKPRTLRSACRGFW
jgi:aspartate aminotransferase